VLVTSLGVQIHGSAAGGVPFLELFGIVAGGWQLARAALAAQRLLMEGTEDREFLRAKQLTARFYADHVLSAAPGIAEAVSQGTATLDYPDGAF